MIDGMCSGYMPVNSKTLIIHMKAVDVEFNTYNYDFSYHGTIPQLDVQYNGR